MATQWPLFFGFHTLYESYAALINIFKPAVFGEALGETSVRWQSSLGCAQLSLALVTLLFIGDTANRAGAKASLIALNFHVLVTGKMALGHVAGTAPIKPKMFYSHVVLCAFFARHIAVAWPKQKIG